MLYFFYDNKTGKSLTKARKLFNDLKQKKPDATFVELDEHSVSVNELFELIESQGLFETKIVCLLKNISLNKEIEKEMKRLVTGVADASSVFIWLETSLNKAPLELLESKATKSFLEKEGVKEKKVEVNVFKLAEYFGARDKKNLWKFFVELKKENIPAEEIHGILWWQLKSILLTLGAKTAEEAGLKSFVFSKAKGFARNFKEEELQHLADMFVVIYHEAHRGNSNLYDELEKIILEI